ncbi:MAG: hypothetical protein ACQES4_05890 [Bacillota bacterium]
MSSNNHNNKSQQKDLVFFLRIQYRCNSSWQGTIQWLGGKQESVFRSALELGNLINDAKGIRSADKQKSASKWEDKESAS